jgi:hypothetical protein
MTDASSDSDNSGPGRSRRDLAIALLLALLTVVWLALTAHNRSDEPQQFLGLWRLRHVLSAFATIWLASAFLAAAVSRKALFKWLAVSTSAALALLLVEVAGDVGLINTTKLQKSQQVNPYGAKRLPNVDVGGVTYQDIWTHWGIKSPAMPYRFKTDARGFRNDKDRDAADIYLVGDSLLVAGLVPFENTVTSRLEQNLGRPVMNISLIGLSVQAERDLLMEANPPLKDRLVVHFVFEGNDPLDSRAYRQQKATKEQVASKIDWKTRSPTYNLLMKLQALTAPVDPLAARRTGYIGDQPYGFLWVAEMVRGTEKEFPYILAALADTRKFVEAGGGHYAVVVVPEKYRVLAPLCRWPDGSDLSDYQSNLSPMSGVVMDWCKREGVPVLDLMGPLQKAAQDGRIPWFQGDTHLNENGHQAAADAIAEWIKSQK